MVTKREMQKQWKARDEAFQKKTHTTRGGQAFFVHVPPVIMGYNNTPKYYDMEIKSVKHNLRSAEKKKMWNSVAALKLQLRLLLEEKKRAVKAQNKRNAFDATSKGKSWAAMIRQLEREKKQQALDKWRAKTRNT